MRKVRPIVADSIWSGGSDAIATLFHQDLDSFYHIGYCWLGHAEAAGHLGNGNTVFPDSKVTGALGRPLHIDS